jgi:hypothetical protein
MDILGIRLGPEPKADDEYVASVRAWTRYPRTSAAANACAAVLLFAVFMFWAWLTQELTSRMAGRQNVYWSSSALSLGFAAWSGFLLALGGYGTVFGRRGPCSSDCRTECLMLRFHDERNTRNGEDAASAPSGSAGPGAEGRRIPGIRLRPERRTDPQYVEFVRKWVGQFKWLRILHVALSVLCLAGAVGPIVFWTYVVGLIRSAPDELPPPVSISAGLPGIIAGVAWGLIAGWILWRTCEPLSRLGRVLAGCRAERLMLTYYDELQRREGDSQTAPTAGP